MRRDLNLFHFIRHHARLNGEAPAIITATEIVSYEELRRQAERLAAGLSREGIGSGARIALLAENSSEYIQILAACARSGAVAVPINWRSSAEEIRRLIDLTEPHAILAGEGYLPLLEDVDLGRFQLAALVGPGSSPAFSPMEDLYAKSDDEIRPPDQEAPFVILPTAAVEGIPRGAVLSHGNLIFAGLTLLNALDLDTDDRHLAALPLFHITGLGLSLTMIMAGAANVVAEGFDPGSACEMIDEHGVTLMASFPPVLSLLLQAKGDSGARWQDLRYVLGLDSPEVIQQLLSDTGAEFWTGFGQSETSGVVTLGSAQERPGSAGRATPFAQVDCVQEDGEPAPLGEEGEIVVRGPLVFQGYWGDPDATSYAFRAGWHHTGDLGKFDADGYLYYLGRKPEKALIKSGGENVYPAEVEHVISGLPGVAAVCVIGVPDETWGEAVKAVIELKPGAALTQGQVQDSVSEKIAAFKKPRQVAFVDALPRDAEGAVDRVVVKREHGAPN